MNTKNALIGLLAAFLVVGCQSNMTKEQLGQTIGAVGGAVLGAQLGGDNKVLAAAIGAVAGYFAGKMIGRYLSEQERKSLAADTVDALEREKAGTTVWKSPQSGASADIRTGKISYKVKERKVVHLKSVKTVPGIKLENREYQTISALRVRQGPGTQYQTITTLRPGDVVHSTGRTDNGWLMLAKNGVTVGYVYGKYVKPYDPVAVAREKGIDLDKVDVAEVPRHEGLEGIDLDAVETTSSVVETKVGCRDVEINVKTKKGTETEKIHACQQDDGVWQLG